VADVEEKFFTLGSRDGIRSVSMRDLMARMSFMQKYIRPGYSVSWDRKKSRFIGKHTTPSPQHRYNGSADILETLLVFQVFPICISDSGQCNLKTTILGSGHAGNQFGRTSKSFPGRRYFLVDGESMT
jgi:hypothetical protein